MAQSESEAESGPDATPSTARPVVVAVGNQPADSALEYAAQQALREGCGLHLIHVLHPGPTGPESALLDYTEVDQVGHDLLQAAVERAGDLLGGRAPLTSALLRGPVVSTLLEATEGTARAVVMQRRDVSRVIRSVTRSISSGVASHAHVPVVSVPAGWSEAAVERNHGRPVVTVGVDVPGRCAPVVATAAAEARSRDGSLHVLHTWWFPSVYDDVITSRVENAAWADRAREEIQAVVAGLGDAVRGVPVEIEARHAHPADALLDAGRESTLLVVGRHDPLVPFGSHLGPVARAVLRDAGCPVLLANPTDAHGIRRRHHHSTSDTTTPESMVMF
ncbi:universal stress protein [Nocardioides panaciterrulae]|uniref:Nucleotide-binding universal stress UspA family protein n=1 Tax=Nocardioides panaciterrulae TaxID=661492 RepID=A0A7Y9E568_9ACTN|nr:universal stress protein [Nocardioides panaciterrulae]NYD41187.1 nucleotide-binding universal stress UspA family protein [Nocardioides panaciterrulae]